MPCCIAAAGRVANNDWIKQTAKSATRGLLLPPPRSLLKVTAHIIGAPLAPIPSLVV